MNLTLLITNIMVEDILDDNEEEFLESLERGVPGFPGDGESLEQEA